MHDGRITAPEAARRLGGAATWADLVRHSSPHAVRAAVRAGALRRTAPGVYALPDAGAARLAATAARGVVSHTSAALHWRFDLLRPPEAVHVTVPRRSRPAARKGVVLHYRDVPAQDDRDGVTSPLRTVLDCALVLPLPEALAVADSALRLGVVDADELARTALGRRGPGRARLLRVAQEATPLAANGFESGLRGLLVQAGLHGFVPQLPVPVPGRTVHVDLGDPDARIALEADSFAFHGSREALERDCRRYDDLVRSGWLVLRFAWEQVLFDPLWVTEVVADTRTLRNVARQKSR